MGIRVWEQPPNGGGLPREVVMEFLVEFDLHVPEGTPENEIQQRESAEARASAELGREGILVRLWRQNVAPGQRKAVGLYRAETAEQLDGLLSGLPLSGWMRTTVKPLQPHPNDPVSSRRRTFHLPYPRMTALYRLEADLGEPIDLGEEAQGHRRIVPLTGGTFAGPEISGMLVPGASADWQTILADGTALGDIRYTLRTDAGELIDVRSRSVRHGPADVLARLGRGEDVDPSEYTFRAATEIQTGAPGLRWLNKGVFMSVAGRQQASVIYETYLVGLSRSQRGTSLMVEERARSLTTGSTYSIG